VRDVATWQALIAGNPSLRLVKEADDLFVCQTRGQVGVILGFQNGAMLGTDPARVEQFADGGVRVFQLTYNIRNRLGDGSMVAENRGLTQTGRDMMAAIESGALSRGSQSQRRANLSRCASPPPGSPSSSVIRDAGR
jgi:membrane dipeptidase